jgi:hypothetical protein
MKILTRFELPLFGNLQNLFMISMLETNNLLPNISSDMDLFNLFQLLKSYIDLSMNSTAAVIMFRTLYHIIET